MSKIKTDKSVHWDRYLDNILDENVLNRCLDSIKVHQLSTNGSKLMPYNREIFAWLDNIEYTDIIPNFYLDEIKVDVEKVKFQHSYSSFI